MLKMQIENFQIPAGVDPETRARLETEKVQLEEQFAIHCVCPISGEEQQPTYLGHETES